MAVTILQVAQKANVSRMTVSRVLRGDSRVNTETCRRVLQAMQEMEYIPKPAARAMRSKDKLRETSALCLALIFGVDTQLADGFFCDVARSAEQEAAANGLSLLQVHWQDSFERSWPRLQSVFSMSGLCGVILAGQFADDEVKAIYHHVQTVVMIDGPAPQGIPVASVESDNINGCKLAMEHLIHRGCRRVLVLTGPQEHYFARAMRSAAETFRSRLESLEIVNDQFTSEGGKATVSRLWSQGHRFDGIFGNDEMAIGALRVLADLKISVPNQVAVVGFDDIPHAEFISPSLTSISIDKRQLGQQAVKTLIDVVRNPRHAGEVKKVITANW